MKGLVIRLLVISLIILGLIFLSLVSVTVIDERTQGEGMSGLFTIIFSKLFYVLRFPTHTVFFQSFSVGHLFFAGLAINIMFWRTIIYFDNKIFKEMNRMQQITIKFSKMKNIVVLLMISILLSCSNDCNPEIKNRIRQLPIKNIDQIADLNAVFLRNLELLADSCCQNLGKSCAYPDSVKANIFFPATKFLLYKYLPESEKKYLDVLDKLSTSKLQNNDDVLTLNVGFRIDSTVRYPVFYSICGDSITQHYLIYQSGNKRFKFREDIVILRDSTINLNWTYYIVRYKDIGW